jgi:hypothetical protein
MTTERTVARQITVYAFERLCSLPGCGQWFEIRLSHPKQAFCSRRCRKRAENARKRARYWGAATACGSPERQD